MSDTVTINKEQLRLAILHGWSDCMPAAHMSLDAAWAWLQEPDPQPCEHRAGGDYGYDFDSDYSWA